MASDELNSGGEAAPEAPVAWAETPPLRVLGQRDRPAPDAPGISVFFPAYNDGGTIASMVLAAAHTCAKLTDDYEIIVGDDASTDYTAEVLDDLAARDPHVRVLHHPKNLGYGGNLRAGFAAATKELVFYTD